jgi:hypothetical protein
MAVTGASATYFNSCLTEKQRANLGFPGIETITDGFRLLPPVSKHALPIISVMCEFCLCPGEQLQVIRVIIVNEKLEPIFNEFVRPKGEVTDFLTTLHNIQPWQILTAKCELSNVHDFLMESCDQNTVIVGHDLSCDLRGLQIAHFRVADTKILFNPQEDKKLGLPNLSKYILKKRITKPENYPQASMELFQLYHAHGGLKKQKLQRSFGSKQDLITRVHTKIVAKYQERLVVPVTTCLRGKDTIRIHCKKWDQLNQIESVLEKIDSIQRFYQICLPISMKTKSQKKGFFVYLKFFNVAEVGDVLKYVIGTGIFKAEIADRPTKISQTAI